MASIKKRPDGKWRARYRDRHGKEHSKHFDRKTDGQDWLDEVTASVVTGRYVNPRAGRQKFRDYAEAWRARQVHTDSTAETYEGILRLHCYPTLGTLPMESINPSDVQSLVKAWAKSAAPTTVETRFTVLSIVLKAAVTDRVIAETPCVSIKLPKVAPKAALVPITTQTVLDLHSAIAPRYKAFVTVGGGTGMRRGELLGLSDDRVFPAFGQIRVDRQLSRRGSGNEVVFAALKTDASLRTLPVAELVIDTIAEHIDEYGVHESGVLFTTEIGTPLRPSTLWTAWTRAAREVGTEATPHDLRHYYASMQIRGGQSVKVLQALLGHKSATETWDTYGHLWGDEDDRSRELVQTALGNLADSLRTKGA